VERARGRCVSRAGGSRREQERRPRWELGEQLAALAVARRRNTSEQECVGVGMRAQEHAGAGGKHWCEVRGMSGARDWWRAMRGVGARWLECGGKPGVRDARVRGGAERVRWANGA
jgi:hypothetical protein